LFSLIGTALGTIFQALSPIFSSLFNYQTAKVEAEAGVATASIQATEQVESKWWFVAALIPAIALPFAIYIWKAVAWDKVIGPMFDVHSSTDPINGPLGTVFIVVIGGLFFHSFMSLFK